MESVSPTTPVAKKTGGSRNETLKIMRMMVEYKHLQKSAPAGVYLLPAPGQLRVFHGAIFVRRALYKDGVFKFTLTLPPEYNDVDTFPRVVFQSRVYNPCVDPRTNELDLRLRFPQWNPEEHFLVNVLLWVKKIFYLTSFDDFSTVPNSTAKELLKDNKEEYIRLVRQCVDESVARRYENPEGFAFKMAEPTPAHDELLKRILRDTNPNLFSSPVRERAILQDEPV